MQISPLTSSLETRQPFSPKFNRTEMSYHLHPCPPPGFPVLRKKEAACTKRFLWVDLGTRSVTEVCPLRLLGDSPAHSIFLRPSLWTPRGWYKIFPYPSLILGKVWPLDCCILSCSDGSSFPWRSCLFTGAQRFIKGISASRLTTMMPSGPPPRVYWTSLIFLLLACCQLPTGEAQ